MTLDQYLAYKWQRPIPAGSMRSSDVLVDFCLGESLGSIRAVDIASLHNSIEIVRIGGETGLIFDHNYFAYVCDLITCFLSEDSDGQHRHLNYIVNRFLLEETLQYNADELTAGLLHVVLLQDHDGVNPLGHPRLSDASQILLAQSKVRHFQLRLFVAHEIGHAALAFAVDARANAGRRLNYLLDGVKAIIC